jgi:hypothetical protein
MAKATDVPGANRVAQKTASSKGLFLAAISDWRRGRARASDCVGSSMEWVVNPFHQQIFSGGAVAEIGCLL